MKIISTGGILILIGLITTAFVLGSIAQYEYKIVIGVHTPARQAKAEEQKEKLKSWADKKVKSIYYIMDTRPIKPICYGVMKSAELSNYTIRSMTTVSCENVKSLLIN